MEIISSSQYHRISFNVMSMFWYGILATCLWTRSTYGERTCVSCSGVNGSSSCPHHIQCTGDEVCFMSSYTTESSAENYDFGCSHKQACPSLSTGAFVGKRSEGHHMLCYKCCDNADFCNHHLLCDTATLKPDIPHTDLKTNHGSGVYTIYPFGVAGRPVQARCEFDSNGRVWTVIQRRIDGSVNFYRDWDSYKNGFGDPSGEYWIGNDVIHQLTSSYHHELMINMSLFNGTERYAAYSTFSIGDEADGYRLTVNAYIGYTGNAGDYFSYHTGRKFSTYDKNSHLSSQNCAESLKGAWWFNNCGLSDLNGEYLSGNHTSGLDHGVYWNGLGTYYSLKSTSMMIRAAAD